MGEVARHMAVRLLLHPEGAGHAQMHDQHLAAVEICEQIFRPTGQGCDNPPLQPLHEALGEGKAQIRAAAFEFQDARAFKIRLQAAPDRLDLGQFGHGKTYRS